MKILAIFVDMLGADYLNCTKADAKHTDLDSLFQNMGGTFYTNCYTPSPDTPRSTACMWTGVYPKENGCNNRLKYPGRFLTVKNHLWKVLDENGYHFNVYLRRTNNEIGLLPKPYEKHAFYGNIDEFLDMMELKDNSFTFLYLPDLHTILDNYGYNAKTIVKGNNFVAKLLNRIFEKYDKDLFDYIMVFSDHGFRYELTKREFLLDTDRIRTTMFIRKKGESALSKNDKLCSNLDVFPTICEMIGAPLPQNIDGCSVLSSCHEYVLLEDHEDFSVRLGQTIEHWGVVLKNGIYRLECSGRWYKADDSDFDEAYWEETVRRKMDDYMQNRQLWDALHIYDNNKVVNTVYSDGTIIKKSFKKRKLVVFFRIIFIKFKNLFNWALGK